MANSRFSFSRLLACCTTALFLLLSGTVLAEELQVYPTMVHSGNGILHNNFGECWGTGPNNVTTTPPTECMPAAPAPKMTPPPVAPAPAQAEPHNLSVTLSAEVLFDFDKSTIKTSGKKAIDEVLSQVGMVKIKSIRVDGHTDGVGSDAYNQKLSMRRALAVKKYLDSKHMMVNIEAVGHGKRDPVADNHTAAGRAKNRRAEITFEE